MIAPRGDPPRGTDAAALEPSGSRAALLWRRGLKPPLRPSESTEGDSPLVQADDLRRQQILQRRFEAMGLEVGLLPGGRSLLVTLPVSAEPFPTPQGARVVRAVRFFTVGHDRIKCVAPRALFHVPLVRIVDCETPADLEARVRAAWALRLDALERAGRWLRGLGIDLEAPQGAPQWTLPLGLEDERAHAIVVEPERVVLPSRGPLSGLPLARAEERVFAPEGCRSSTDLELAVTSRLEELARGRRRSASPRTAGDTADLPAPRSLRRAPVLVVGSHVATDRGLHESLRLRGFEVQATHSMADALGAFRERSFELVLAETRLDRGDGLELVPAIRSLPGIQELPVALLDDRPREGRRNAARAAGASAYLSGPLDGAGIAGALVQLAAQDRRRFTRYERALSVSWPGCEEPGVSATVGRGGMFVKTPRAVPSRGRYAIHLAEAGATLAVDAELSYRLPETGARPEGPEGIGLRFCGFEPGGEATWIDYLARLAPLTARPTPASRAPS